MGAFKVEREALFVVVRSIALMAFGNVSGSFRWSFHAATIRLEASLLKDFVPCLSIAARHAARLRRTQTARRV